MGLKSNSESLFAMPILRCQIDEESEFNQLLDSAVRQRMEKSKGLVRSNQAGWHSALDLHQWDDPAIQKLMQCFKDAASQFIDGLGTLSSNITPEDWQIEAWANVNTTGASNRKHTHDTKSGVILSSFYYVNCGEPLSEEWQGNTYFEDRDTFPKHYHFEPGLFSRTVENVPKEGEMVIFPSWLPHGVREYRGSGQRITIAVNFWHKELTFTKTTDKSFPGRNWIFFSSLVEKITRLRSRLR